MCVCANVCGFLLAGNVLFCSTDGGPFVFGNFNNAARQAPGVIDVWSAILHQVPTAVLRLKRVRVLIDWGG